MKEQKPRVRSYVKPWIFGVSAGTVFVLIEVLFRFYPPSAYAFCLSCHTRDLVNTIVNGFFRTAFQVARPAETVLMITSPAVLLGALFASALYREHSFQKSSAPVRFFLIGFVMMLIGILIFGCPTRITLRSGYGDVYAIGALAAMFAGIWVGTVLLRRRSVR